MKRTFLMLALISSFMISTSVYAEDVEKNYSPFFVIPDVLIYRPVGVVVTVVGAGLLVATSPFTALAQIAPPHNAFEKMSDILVMGPVNFTFQRPVGNMAVTGY